MKPVLRITRAHFPNESMLYWMTYFEYVLSKKYEVVIDPINPDICFYSNLYCTVGELDAYTNAPAKSLNDYGNDVKKIYISGEVTVDHATVLDAGENYFAIGPTSHNTTAAWGLYYESKLFNTPYDWMLQSRNGDEILSNKKYFCGVVQNSTVPQRQELFDKLSAYKFVRASGQWITNVPPEEMTITHPRIDGDGYRSKVEFLRNCKFSMQIQTANLRYFTQEKMVHAFAAYTIPIFWGNDMILDDGFNPECFVNCHDFESFDAVVERVKEIDTDDNLYKKMITSPYFVDNKLPYYYDDEYILEFFGRLIDA
jgi:hypothetical protein